MSFEINETRIYTCDICDEYIGEEDPFTIKLMYEKEVHICNDCMPKIYQQFKDEWDN